MSKREFGSKGRTVKTIGRDKPQDFLQCLVRATIRTTLLLTAVLSISFSVFASNQVFRQVYPLLSGGSFVLENVNGSVVVDGWERNEVEVSAVKTAKSDPQDLERVKIEVDSHPGQVLVHTRYPKGEGVEVAVEYHVHVPYRVLLQGVQTVNGSVMVRGVEGGGDLKSVNGNVEVLDSTGRFSEKTTNGNLRLELRKLLDGGPMNLETVNGSVVLGLPASAQADLNVLSMNGDFYSELPVSSKVGSPRTPEFQAKLGAGGGQISMRTINGGIRLVLQQPRV